MSGEEGCLFWSLVGVFVLVLFACVGAASAWVLAFFGVHVPFYAAGVAAFLIAFIISMGGRS